MAILVFEDSRVPQLAPIATARPAYQVSCGGYRLLDLLPRLEQPLFGFVRPHLRAFQDLPEFGADDAVRWIVNARLAPSCESLAALERLIRADRPCAVHDHGQLAAAVLPASLDSRTLQAADDSWLQSLGELPEAEASLPLLEFPHDVVAQNLKLLPGSLADRLERGGYREVRDGVFVAEGVSLGEYLATDSAGGPIVIDRGVKVGPHCHLSGPAYIGPNARLIEHASIKDACCIGHTVKIGGEVEASVIEPYTNKQHYGFLGHSYLGSWINLGAGTCNSDLKNTYGAINMEYNGLKVASGMQFMGCVIGDYSKSAINTGIFTGKCVGVCSMLYGFVTTNVPSFVNYARLFGQVSELPAEVMVATQQRMFLRRGVEQRECDRQLIHDMYALTRHERQTAGDQLSL